MMMVMVTMIKKLKNIHWNRTHFGGQAAQNEQND